MNPLTALVGAATLVAACVLGAQAVSGDVGTLRPHAKPAASSAPPVRSVTGKENVDGTRNQGEGVRASAHDAGVARSAQAGGSGGTAAAVQSNASAGERTLRTPAPVLARDLAPTDRVQVVPYARWQVLQQVAPDLVVTLARTGFCESGWDVVAVGLAGEQGAYQVMARYWGEVPPTFAAQTAQAASIMREHGTKPWTTKDGCLRWN